MRLTLGLYAKTAILAMKSERLFFFGTLMETDRNGYRRSVLIQSLTTYVQINKPTNRDAVISHTKKTEHRKIRYRKCGNSLPRHFQRIRRIVLRKKQTGSVLRLLHCEDENGKEAGHPRQSEPLQNEFSPKRDEHDMWVPGNLDQDS